MNGLYFIINHIINFIYIIKLIVTLSYKSPNIYIYNSYDYMIYYLKYINIINIHSYSLHYIINDILKQYQLYIYEIKLSDYIILQ